MQVICYHGNSRTSLRRKRWAVVSHLNEVFRYKVSVLKETVKFFLAKAFRLFSLFVWLQSCSIFVPRAPGCLSQKGLGMRIYTCKCFEKKHKRFGISPRLKQ